MAAPALMLNAHFYGILLEVNCAQKAAEVVFLLF